VQARGPYWSPSHSLFRLLSLLCHGSAITWLPLQTWYLFPGRVDRAPRRAKTACPVGPTSTPPTGPRAASGSSTRGFPGRGRARPRPSPAPRPCRPCAAALVGSVPGRPRGSGPAWQRPRFSPVLPGPTRKASWREPEGVCPAAHWPGRACTPRGPAGRLSLCGQSETCPGGFVRAGQSRGPGSDQPTSSARDLLPASSSDAERGLRRSPPMRVRWYNRDCGVYPLGARAITRPRGQRA